MVYPTLISHQAIIASASAFASEEFIDLHPLVGAVRPEAAGRAGVHHVLERQRAELALDLMLCGLASPAEVTRDLLVPAAPPDRRVP